MLNNATTQGFNTGLAANNQAYNQNKGQYDSNLAATQQGFQQAAYNQMQPINVINALRTGSQVTNPTFASVPQQATTAGADLLGAATAQYNGQLGAYNAQQASGASTMNGLFGLGSAGIMAFSDRRMKQGIRRIGVLDNGITLYSFKYRPEFNLGGGEQVGVMADEVEQVIPAAVVTTASGYKQVDYRKVYQAEGA